MFNSSTMSRMLDEVIRDHDLPSQPSRIFEPADKSWTWCAEFADPQAEETGRIFQVCVQWPDGSTYESVKADLARQLLARFRR